MPPVQQGALAKARTKPVSTAPGAMPSANTLSQTASGTHSLAPAVQPQALGPGSGIQKVANAPGAANFGPNFAATPGAYAPGTAGQPPGGAITQAQTVTPANPDGTAGAPKMLEDNKNNPAAISDTDQLYKDQLTGADKMFADEQKGLQSQMAGFQRQADSLNARMGGSIAGGYAGLAGSALGQGMNAYANASNEYQKNRNDIMMKWAERKQTVEDRDKQNTSDNLDRILGNMDNPEALSVINGTSSTGNITMPGDKNEDKRTGYINDIDTKELPQLNDEAKYWQDQINALPPGERAGGGAAGGGSATYQRLVNHLHNVKDKIDDANRRKSAFQWRIDNNAAGR